MYINSISNYDNLHVCYPQFKSKGKIPKITALGMPKKALGTLFLSGLLMFGAVSCKDNQTEGKTDVYEKTLVQEIKPEEIAKYPNLNQTKLQSVIDLSESILESFYNTAFTYTGIIYNENNFEIHYSSPEYEKNNNIPMTIKYDSNNNEFYSFPKGSIKLKNDVDGTYILNYSKLDFKHTIDGKLKNLPSTTSDDKKNIVLLYANKNKELIAKQTKDTASIQDKPGKGFNDEIEYIKSIPILKGVDPYAIERLAKAMNYDIDFSENILFLDGQGVGWRLNVKPTVIQPDRAIFIGKANGMTDKGGSKNYLIRLEFSTSPKADRIIISKVEVELEGVEDDSPAHKKIDGTIQVEKTLGKTTKKHNLKGGGAGGGLGVPLGNVLLGIGGGGFGANLTTDEINQIDKFVMSVYPEMKTTKEIIYKKQTDKLTIIGR